MTGERTVLFVCLHGAAMSRVAAAYFNRAAPSGWRAVSAGVDPADMLSPTAETLLAGTGAEEFLDRSPLRGHRGAWRAAHPIGPPAWMRGTFRHSVRESDKSNFRDSARGEQRQILIGSAQSIEYDRHEPGNGGLGPQAAPCS
jgi:hypothetical protein